MSVRVCAMLSWWHEPGDELRTLIPSLAGLADVLIAMDGAYQGVPGGETRSPEGQIVTIKALCAEHEIELVLDQPERLYKGEVEKRNVMAQLALEQNPDWVFPCDADWKFVGDPDRMRSRLLFTSADGVNVRMRTPLPRDRRMVRELAPHKWHRTVAGKSMPYPVFHRALPGLTVERHHWWYSGIKRNRRVALSGCQGVYPAVKREYVSGWFEVEHRCFLRDRAALDRRRVFYEHRDPIVQQTGREL